MTSGTDILDAVVIGAGWAGLGVSHALTQRGLRHRVLERGRIDTDRFAVSSQARRYLSETGHKFRISDRTPMKLL